MVNNFDAASLCSLKHMDPSCLSFVPHTSTFPAVSVYFNVFSINDTPLWQNALSGDSLFKNVVLLALKGSST